MECPHCGDEVTVEVDLLEEGEIARCGKCEGNLLVAAEKPKSKDWWCRTCDQKVVMVRDVGEPRIGCQCGGIYFAVGFLGERN